jgi:hypothetical protein
MSYFEVDAFVALRILIVSTANLIAITAGPEFDSEATPATRHCWAKLSNHQSASIAVSLRTHGIAQQFPSED